MRKVIYLMWSDTASEEFVVALHSNLLTTLKENAAINRVQLNVPDRDVAAAASLRMENSAPAFDAMCSIWLSTELELDVIDGLIDGFCVQFSRYHVDEIERLENTEHRVALGARTPGFSQIAMLRCPQRLEYQDWLAYWQNTHTRIALETQSTFRYVQNIITGVAGKDIACYHAIVEECFPSQAMTDSGVFYDAIGDTEKQQSNMQKMIDSCVKFIDFDEIDVVPTSEYCY
jgi:hypothetical protein